MKNINFIGRKKEVRQVKELAKENFMLVVKGRRRVGKTTLLRKSLPEARYLFIWPNKSLGWITEKICEEQKLPAFKNFVDSLIYLLDQNKIIIIDEFQNLLYVDKSVYGEVQRLIDERKLQRKFLKIAVAGSSYSLINKVFNDLAAPLYGRRSSEITLEGLSFKCLFKELGLPLAEFMELWAVFEGIPYYYELVDTKLSARENVKRLVLSKEALLQNEGKTVLAVEFGNDSKTYSTVLGAIAEGKTKLREIASLFDNKSNEVVKYLDLLRNEFHLVQRMTPLLSNPAKSKEGHYLIRDNFLGFWFYFADKQKSYLEQERFTEVLDFFEKNFNSFVGKKFEEFILELFSQKFLQRGYEKTGRQWGTIPGAPKGMNQYEIDFCAVNEKTKSIIFGECKWEEKVKAGVILKELQEKAQFVDWNTGEREEKYYLFAKSFENKKANLGKNITLIDLNDLEKILK